MNRVLYDGIVERGSSQMKGNHINGGLSEDHEIKGDDIAGRSNLRGLKLTVSKVEGQRL